MFLEAIVITIVGFLETVFYTFHFFTFLACNIKTYSKLEKILNKFRYRDYESWTCKFFRELLPLSTNFRWNNKDSNKCLSWRIDIVIWIFYWCFCSVISLFYGSITLINTHCYYFFDGNIFSC